MMLSRLPRRAQRLVGDGIITSAARNIISALVDRAAALHVQAKLKTARTETQPPIQRPFRSEIVPLQSHPKPIEIAPELAPAVRHFAPGDGFIVANHRAKFTDGAGANASEVSPR